MSLSASLSRASLVFGALVLTAACDKAQPQTNPAPPTAASDMKETTTVTSQKLENAAKDLVKPKDSKDPMAKLDSDMKKVIDAMGTLGAKPISTLTPEEARKNPTPADAVKAVLTKEGKSTEPEAVAKVEDRMIPTRAGKVAARIYTPKTGKAPYPMIVYFHGGGWVIADLDVYDSSPRALANAAEAVVVSLDYRKAPEAKFPAAHDDAWDGYQWAVANAKSLNASTDKIVVAGESAGGNLALNVSIMARDQGKKVPLAELLVYPVASVNMDQPSYVDNANAKPLDKAGMSWFADKYFRTPADGNDLRISLVNANLKSLPPTTIINAQIDPLLSDGETLAAKMKASGVDVEQKTYDGVTHEFFGMGAVVPAAKDAVKYGASRLKKVF